MIDAGEIGMKLILGGDASCCILFWVCLYISDMLKVAIVDPMHLSCTHA